MHSPDTLSCMTRNIQPPDVLHQQAWTAEHETILAYQLGNTMAEIKLTINVKLSGRLKQLVLPF